jgi:long-subunit fatty acid transport protein
MGAVAIGDVVGIGEYRFKGYEFIPTIAYRESQRFSLGLSPIFSIDEMQNASLPVIVTQWGVHPQDQRSKAGFGLQAGAFYSPTKRLRFGVSVRTPQLINRFTYRWIDPMTGEVGSQRFHFSQDSAFRIAVGVSRTLRNDKTTFAADFRYCDYSHASALYDIPASFDPAVEKQGVARAVYSIAFGAEHRPWDIIAWRMGYQWNHAVSPEKAVIYNTGLPIQSGHSIHYGVTFFFGDHFDLSFSSSNSFGSGRETIQTDNGSISFRRNPNRSNFWASARLRF